MAMLRSSFDFQLKPLRYPDRICTPSPEPIRRSRRSSSSSRQHAASHAPPPPKRYRDASLSTITEEPGSWHSTTHEILLEPELVLEATTITQPPLQVRACQIYRVWRREKNGRSINFVEIFVQASPKLDRSFKFESDSSCNSSPASVRKTQPSPSPSLSSIGTTQSSGHVTTKVTATAKFKVEVHTPFHGSYDRNHWHSRRRDSTSSTSTTSTECSMKLNS